MLGVTDKLLDQLAEVIRAGKTHARAAPYYDPMPFNESSGELRAAVVPGDVASTRHGSSPVCGDARAWRASFRLESERTLRRAPHASASHGVPEGGAAHDVRRGRATSSTATAQGLRHDLV